MNLLSKLIARNALTSGNEKHRKFNTNAESFPRKPFSSFAENAHHKHALLNSLL